MIATTNPDSPAHYLRARYIDRIERGELPDWRIFHFTMDDNPGLTDEYRDSVKREFTGLWYRRFIQGEWVSAEGAVYD
ncbi:PBSX family phage terminase large subunit, partial [Proteus mirabilis]|nr:PBSX family phage terminase large subunit [Proteus mirabilis]